MEAARALVRSARFFHLASLLVGGVCLSTSSTRVDAGTTYQLGPSKPTYHIFQDLPPLHGGDSVLVDGNATYPRVVFTQPGDSSATPGRIVIRGMHGPTEQRPVITGAGVDIAVHFNGAHHYTFDGFEVRHGNTRGIYHQADDLIIRDVMVDSCNVHGIQSAEEGLNRSGFFGDSIT